MAYSQELYNEVNSQYEEIRRRNEKDLAERRERVFANIPEIRAVDEEIKSLGLKLFKLAVSNNSDIKTKIDGLRNEQKALIEKRKDLLLRSGFAEDELNPRYMCDKCRDTGIFEDAYCECFKRKLILRAYESSNLVSELKDQSFDSFDLSMYSKEVDVSLGTSPYEQMSKIYKICRDYAQGSGSAKNLLLWGPPGVGKTFLSTCIAKEFIKSGKTVIYDTAYKIFTLFEDYKFKFNAKNIDEMAFKIDRLYDCDLLVLDDLGAEFKTAYSNAAFFDIINTRLNLSRRTIISTNLSMKLLSERYQERSISRLMGEYMALQCMGEDIRLKNNCE